MALQWDLRGESKATVKAFAEAIVADGYDGDFFVRDNIGNHRGLGLHVFKAGKLHNFLLEFIEGGQRLRLQGEYKSFERLEDLLGFYGRERRRGLPTRLEYNENEGDVTDSVSVANSLIEGVTFGGDSYSSDEGYALRRKSSLEKKPPGQAAERRTSSFNLGSDATGGATLSRGTAIELGHSSLERGKAARASVQDVFEKELDDLQIISNPVEEQDQVPLDPKEAKRRKKAAAKAEAARKKAEKKAAKKRKKNSKMDTETAKLLADMKQRIETLETERRELRAQTDELDERQFDMREAARRAKEAKVIAEEKSKLERLRVEVEAKEAADASAAAKAAAEVAAKREAEAAAKREAEAAAAAAKRAADEARQQEMKELEKKRQDLLRQQEATKKRLAAERAELERREAEITAQRLKAQQEKDAKAAAKKAREEEEQRTKEAARQAALLEAQAEEAAHLAAAHRLAEERREAERQRDSKLEQEIQSRKKTREEDKGAVTQKWKLDVSRATVPLKNSAPSIGFSSKVPGAGSCTFLGNCKCAGCSDAG